MVDLGAQRDRRADPVSGAETKLARTRGRMHLDQHLGVTGEVVIDVPTLALPEDGDANPETLLRSDAVALFVERASAVQTGFAVNAANAPAILRVCTHVDGIPLALELAAVRLERRKGNWLARRSQTFHLVVSTRKDPALVSVFETPDGALAERIQQAIHRVAQTLSG